MFNKNGGFMNILREFRRVKKRSIATRIKLLLLFSVILINKSPKPKGTPSY